MTHSLRALDAVTKEIREIHNPIVKAKKAQLVLDQVLIVLIEQNQKISVLEAQLNTLKISTEGARNDT